MVWSLLALLQVRNDTAKIYLLIVCLLFFFIVTNRNSEESYYIVHIKSKSRDNWKTYKYALNSSYFVQIPEIATEEGRFESVHHSRV